MNLPAIIKRLLGLVKETYIDGVKALTTKEGLKILYGVSLYRNAVYLMLNYAVTAILGFAFWILAARFCSAEEVGVAAAIIAVAGFLASLSTLGLDYGLIRFIPNSGKKFNSLVNSCLTISGLAAIIVAFLFLAGLNIWSPALIFLRQSPLTLFSFVAFVAAWALSLLVTNLFIAQKRAEFTLFQSGINAFTKLGLIIPLAALLSAYGIFASWGIACILVVGITLLLFLPRVQGGYHPSFVIQKAAVIEMAHFSSTNYVAAIIARSPSFVLPLMIINLLGAEQNAYYYIAFTIANALFQVPYSISLSFFAEGSHNEAGLRQYINRSLKFSLFLLIPLIILIFLIGDKILLLFGRGYSEEATRFLWLLALSALPMVINALYLMRKRVEKKMKSVIILSSSIMVVILTASYFLLPVSGIVAVGIAYIIGQGVVMLLILGDWLTKGRRKFREI